MSNYANITLECILWPEVMVHRPSPQKLRCFQIYLVFSRSKLETKIHAE